MAAVINESSITLLAPPGPGLPSAIVGVVARRCGPSSSLDLSLNGTAWVVDEAGCVGGGGALGTGPTVIRHGVDWQTWGADPGLLPAQAPPLWESAFDGEARFFVAVSGAAAAGAINVTRSDDVAAGRRVPAVLLPVGDETGVRADEDLGLAADAASGMPEGTASAWLGARGGLLDATLPPFYADPSGVRDSTAALQRAADFARSNYMVVWLPAGDYAVSDTLWLRQTPRLQGDGSPAFNFTTNYCWTRFVPNVIVGPAAGQGRARIVLRPGSGGFGDSGAPKAVVYFETINAEGRTQSNINMAQGLVSVDVVVGADNDGAVGVHLRSAQGSSLEDVTVDLTASGLTGIHGLPGSGGSDSHVTVLGGSYGIDARGTQPAPTLTAATLTGQRCSSLIHEGSETLSVVALNATLGPGAKGPAIVSAARITANMLGCAIPAEPRSPSGADGRVVPRRGKADSAYQTGQLSLVDSVVDASSSGAPAVLVAAPLFASGTYVRSGGPEAVAVWPQADPSQEASVNASGTGWTALDLAAFPVDAAPSEGLRYPTRGFIGGRPVPGTPSQLSIRQGVPAPPDGLIAAHRWGDDGQSLAPGARLAVVVKDAPFLAAGDGYTDDTSAIQAALRAASALVPPGPGAANSGLVPVFLPRGVYRVSSTITVPPGVALVGVSRHLSVLVPSPAGLTGSVPLPGSPPAAVVHVQGSAVSPPAAFGFASVTVPEHLANVSAVRFDAPGRVHGSGGRSTSSATRPTAAKHSQTEASRRAASPSTMKPQPPHRVPSASRRAHGVNATALGAPSAVRRRALYRSAWQHRWNTCGSTWDRACSAAHYGAPLLESPMVSVLGVGGFGLPPVAFFAFFLEDFMLQGPGARHLLVRNATGGGEEPPSVPVAGFSCYHCNVEHGRGDANMEVDGSEGVRIFGIKSEGNFAVLWVRSSSNVTMTGYGGNAAAFPWNSSYPQGHAQFPPSLFRVQASHGTLLGNLVGQGRSGSTKAPCGFPGCPYDPAAWSMVYQEIDQQGRNVTIPPLTRPVLFASPGM